MDLLLIWEALPWSLKILRLKNWPNKVPRDRSAIPLKPAKGQTPKIENLRDRPRKPRETSKNLSDADGVVGAAAESESKKKIIVVPENVLPISLATGILPKNPVIDELADEPITGSPAQ